MGKVLSSLTKPFKNYNLENRAHKIISKEKPIPAPKYRADAQQYEQILKDYPDILKDVKAKHEPLDERLKSVYVTSHDPEIKQNPTNPERPLPVDRKIVQDFEYGYKEVDKVSEGYTTLRCALEFINNHQNNPKLYTVNKISNDYSLPEKAVSNILKYYKVFEIYIPEQRNMKAKFFGPKVKRHTLKIKDRPQIEQGPEENKKS